MVASSGGAEVSASGSHAALAAEIADLRAENTELRRLLWALIGSSKRASPFLPGIPRHELLDDLLSAEAALSIIRGAR